MEKQRCSLTLIDTDESIVITRSTAECYEALNISWSFSRQKHSAGTTLAPTENGIFIVAKFLLNIPKGQFQCYVMYAQENNIHATNLPPSFSLP